MTKKRPVKTWALLILAVAAGIMALSPRAQAQANTPNLEISELNETSYVLEVTSNNSVAINLAYIGSSTEAYVTISQTQMNFFAPFNTPDTSIGGTSYGTTGGTFDLTVATTQTIGKICDKINQSKNYRCTQVGARRDDNAALLRDQTETAGTNNLQAVGGFDVGFDTGGVAAASQASLLRLGVWPNPGMRTILDQCQTNIGGSSQTFRVYGVLRKYEGGGINGGPRMTASQGSLGLAGAAQAGNIGSGSILNGPAGTGFGKSPNDSTVVFRDDLVAASTYTFRIAGSGAGSSAGGIEFGKDTHLVVEASDTSQVQYGTNYLRCWFRER